MLITDVTLAGRAQAVDVRCAHGLVVEVGAALRAQDEAVIDGKQGALLPGLHDHHIHLFALAAHLASVQCGPPHVMRPAELERALQVASTTGWVRGVGYHESVAGQLDRWQLDRMVSDRPVKVQHRSGKMWVVNSLAADLLSLDDHTHLPGVELNAQGRANGRLFRLDNWMRAQLDGNGLPSLAGVSRRLASYGVTGVTDTSPDNGAVAMAAFTQSVRQGECLQQVRVMGGADLPESECAGVERGELKVMLDEHALPDWESLTTIFKTAHRQGRGVAVHCVTPAELVLALSGLRAVGSSNGDRIEHASLVPDDVLPLLKEVGVRVVTQPGFIHERGDQYRIDLDAAQQDDLYRCRTLLAQNIPVAGSTDAPYGAPDPWLTMRAAVTRTSRAGRVLGSDERVTPEQALALFTSHSSDPGGPGRSITPGASADLCLLDRPWVEARSRLCSEDVRATFCKGQLIYDRDTGVVKEGRDAA